MPADTELAIVLKFVDQATQGASRWHAGERQRIGETSRAQTKADRDALASKQRTLKEATDAAKRAAREQAADARQVARDAAAESRRIARETAAATKAAARDAAAAQKESQADIARAAREASTAQRQAAREATAESKRLAREAAAAHEAAFEDMTRAAKEASAIRRQVDQQAATARKQAEREAAAETNRLARESAVAARQAAKERRQTEREVAAAVRDMERQEVREKRQGEQEKTSATKKALRDELYEMKISHQLKMRQWDEEQKESKKNSETQSEGINSVAKAYMGLRIVSDMAGVARSAMKTVADSTREAGNYARQLSEELVTSRDRLREIAALRGVQGGPTAAFTAGFARQAAESGASTGQLTEFESQFKAQAGAYVGPSEEEFTKLSPEARGQFKMSQEQAEELQSLLLSYALGRGVKPEDAAQLAGTVITKAKVGPDGKVNNEEVLSTFAKLLKVTEMAPGRTSPLLPQLAEVVQESVGEGGEFKSMEDAATLFRVMTRRNPGEGATYARGLLRGLRELQMDDKKREELGLNKNMSVFEQIEQVQKKSEEFAASGQGSENEFLSKHFKDIREFGAARTAINEGIRGGEIKRAQAEAASVDASTVRAGAKAYRGSEAGGVTGQKSRVEAARLEAAAKYENLRKMELDAQESLAVGGELEKPEALLDAILTKSGEEFGQGGRDEQEVMRTVIVNLKQKLSRYREGREWLAKHDLKTSTPASVLAEGANLLSRLSKQARTRTAANRQSQFAREQGAGGMKAYKSLEEFEEKAEPQERDQFDSRAAKGGVAAEAPDASVFQDRARAYAADAAKRQGIKASPEEIEQAANALMQDAGRMSHPDFAMPQRRVIRPDFDPMVNPGVPLQQPSRPQNPGEYGRDVGEQLAKETDADQIIKNLGEAAKNLKFATKPRVPPPHPGAPPVMRR